MAAELAQALNVRATLIRGGRGIFDVKVDGELVFSKKQLHRFPDAGEIATLLRDRA